MLPEDLHKDWKPGDPIGYIQPPMRLPSALPHGAPDVGAFQSVSADPGALCVDPPKAADLIPLA